jgi:hypothetical protein
LEEAVKANSAPAAKIKVKAKAKDVNPFLPPVKNVFFF